MQDIRWIGATAVVDLAGDIDLNASSSLQQQLLRSLDRGPERVVINLARVGYMDSSGVATLVKLLSRTRKLGVELLLARMNDRVRSIFEITRLDSVFRIVATEEEALG